MTALFFVLGLSLAAPVAQASSRTHGLDGNSPGQPLNQWTCVVQDRQEHYFQGVSFDKVAAEDTAMALCEHSGHGECRLAGCWNN